MDFLKRVLGRDRDTQPDWIEPADLAELLRGASAPSIIDVRSTEEFDGPLGHIEGAQNVPLDRIAGYAADLLGQQQPIVLVCHTDRRSAAAARVLASAGGEMVSVLRGGMVGWRAGGH